MIQQINALGQVVKLLASVENIAGTYNIDIYQEVWRPVLILPDCRTSRYKSVGCAKDAIAVCQIKDSMHSEKTTRIK